MAEHAGNPKGAPAVRLRGAGVHFDHRVLWSGLDLDIEPGEFVAVLGPNGSGKTTLLKVLLGLQRLSTGSADVCGRPPRRGSSLVGYVPQQRAFDAGVALRGRDLVRLGLDGHRWGIGLPTRSAHDRVQRALEAVGAGGFADAPLGDLSGGEQQRLRIAQALLGDPRVLLCDEPLLSLDPHHQRATSELIDEHRRRAATAVLFVTHEINPVLPYVDRVLYLAGGRWTVGAPDEVMTDDRLSAVYGSRVQVLRVNGRLVVVGGPEGPQGALDDGHHHPEHGPEDVGQ